MKIRESETLELKKSTSELKEGVISIASILNKHGKGKLYFGVKNDGTVVGQQIGEATLRDVSREIGVHVEPRIYPSVTLEVLEEKPCVVVEFSGEDLPYFAYGRAYMRVGDEDRQLSAREIERLVARKNQYRSGWESEVSDAPLSEASTRALRHFVKRANDAGRLVYRYDNARNVLHKLKLLKGRSLLNGGKALFCRDSGVEVQAAVFAGEAKITFLDIQSFKGDLFELIGKSESYVKEHMNWRADLSGSRRVEIPEVPLRAIKEAIVNSLCHRDFSNPKGNEVAIFKNRIEIWNPGRFPDDHTPEDFIRGEEHSILRNPLVANAFYLTSDIERWGSGLKRIHDACREAGVKMEFKRLKSGFAVVFSRQAGGGSEKGSEKSSEKSSEKVLAFLSKNREAGAKDAARALGISQRAVEKHISTLKRMRRLKRIGPDKGGHWEVVL